MAPRRLAPNTLAFMGPVHAPELTKFCYVRLHNVDGVKASVRVVGPDVEDNGQELSLPVSVLELRAVDPSEASLWPGSYIAHPVAFVQPTGPDVGQWAYGVVTRYEVNSRGTWLSVMAGVQVVPVALAEPLRVIKADPITYALQVGAKVSDMVLNPKELLCQQDAAIRESRKRKGDFFAPFRPTLSVPFVPDEVITLVRPHDLSMIVVRRQHVLDCLTGSCKKNTIDLYRDPQATAQTDYETTVARNGTGTQNLDELLSISSMAEDEDIHEVRQLQRTLGKRNRTVDPETRDTRSSLHHNDSDNDDNSDEERGRGAFRPSPTQRRVSRTVLHPRFQGKSPRYVLERMQQSGNAPLRRLPPICRDLFEFGFLARGLTLMHCRPADLWDQVHALDANVSYTDFSERNTLRPAPNACTRTDVSRALRSLREFAQEFYDDAVTSLIDSAFVFVERYKGINDVDPVGWKLMAFWITNKFGKFRSHIVARDLESAQGVEQEFSRVDEELLELMDLP